VMHIPGTKWMVGGGKQGRLYLVNSDDLGGFIGCGSHFDCENPNVQQEFDIGCDVAPAASQTADTPCSAPPLEHLMPPFNKNSGNPCAVRAREADETHHIHGSPVFWRSAQRGPVIYVWGENNILRAFPFDEKQGKFVSANQTPLTVKGCFDQQANPMPPWTLGQAKSPGYFAPEQPNQFAQLHQGMTGGMLTISSNRGQGGIVWATTPTNNDANQKVVPGILRAYDADNLQRELWNSYQARERDDFGNFSKNAPPTVANGKVYLATFSHHLSVYGLRPPSLTITGVNLLKNGDFETQKQMSQTDWTGSFKVNDVFPYYQSSQGALCPDAQHDAMLSQTIIAPVTATYRLTAYCATNIQVANAMPSRFPQVTLGVNVNARPAAPVKAVTAYNGYQKYEVVFKAKKQSRINIWYYAPKVQPVPEHKCGVPETKQPANFAVIDAVMLTQASSR
ncbi:MAG: hypothetical protein HOP19_06805, partial [Acidobacteria bacterium]|nr:hypothetical protein [Acidobacteriota bacterium]